MLIYIIVHIICSFFNCWRMAKEFDELSLMDTVVCFMLGVIGIIVFSLIALEDIDIIVWRKK
jgi:hypothetical protein